jgi:two-component system phosphate regulon sensor histidine kinase PhoR
VRGRLFWKFGLIHLVLFLLVILALDASVLRALRREYIDAALEQLQSLSRLSETEPPETAEAAVLKKWAAWMAGARVRVTLVAPDGKVLADSDEDPSRMDDHIGRSEIREALEKGAGHAVRYSATIGHDLVYLATRQKTADGQALIVRYAIPLQRLAEARSGFRRGLWLVSLAILILAGSVSLLFFRILAARIARFREFASRVAAGDFRPLAQDRHRDELTALAGTMNQTAAQLEETVHKLMEERNQSAAVLAGMAEGVIVVNAAGRVMFCNPAFCRAMNINNQYWQGRPVAEVVPMADLLTCLERARSANGPVTSEVTTGSVRTRSFAVAVTPILSGSEPAGAVLVLHDITEIRRLERARRDFVANVSHEFKTPLTIIQGFAETLRDGALHDPENGRKFIEIIREHAVRLGALTDDLLKLARIEAGKLECRRQTVPIASIVEACLTTARLNARAKYLIVEAEYAADLPPITADPLLLRQVLQNLLDNAVRYSPPGGRITVTAAASKTEVTLSVTDHGPGIPKAEQERIFERFFRADAARDRESGGTGLGLSIAKHLVEMHGGRIQVESEVGLGSTFQVILPL